MSSSTRYLKRRRGATGFISAGEVLRSLAEKPEMDWLLDVINDWPRWTEEVGPFSPEMEAAIVASCTSCTPGAV
jgi:hypothetical protein